MKKYILQDARSAEHTETVFHMRQNAWQCMNNSIDIVKNINKIHVPWAHTKSQVDMYAKDNNEFLKVCKSYSSHAMSLKENDKGIIEAKGRGLIVQITSNIEYGIINELLIIRKERSCNHQYTHQGHDVGFVKGCNTCSESVVSVIQSNNISEIQNAIQKGYILEPFYAPYFHVSILGEVDYNGKKKTVVPIVSFSFAKRYFKEEESTNPFDGF